MKKTKENSENLLDVLLDWQDTETGTILYTKYEIPKAKNPLTITMLKVSGLRLKKTA